MDEHTTLADLLALNLHEFEDEVKNIVDKAVKEMSMEKVLKVRSWGRESWCNRLQVMDCVCLDVFY